MYSGSDCIRAAKEFGNSQKYMEGIAVLQDVWLECVGKAVSTTRLDLDSWIPVPSSCSEKAVI